MHNAANKSLSMSDPITQKKYAPEMTRVFSEMKGLSKDEKDILKSRESILSRLDMKQLENEKNPNVDEGVVLSHICPLMYLNNPKCGTMPVITCSNKLRTYTSARFYKEDELLSIITGGNK